MLADFDNKIGDTVFEDVLKQALAVELGQSQVSEQTHGPMKKDVK